MKLADVTPVFIKKDPLEETNYKPVSVLPRVSTFFERCKYDSENQFHDVNKMNNDDNNDNHHLCIKPTF